MNILTINCGSSSMKFSFYDMSNENLLISGVFEKIGAKDSFYKYENENGKEKCEEYFENHKGAVLKLLDILKDTNTIKDFSDINAIGHRIVHGGDIYDKSVLLTDEVIKNIENLSSLAPLHNPANLIGVYVCKEMFDVPNVAVFDTAFHQTMEEKEFLYALPYSWYTDYKVRKYGFHGTSHKYIAETITEVLDNKNLKVINCHIGNGQSICAIKDGKSINTTMGFTPNSGLIMGTRSGDIDAGLAEYIMDKTGMDIHEFTNELNKKSGLLGISMVSNDHRDVEDASHAGNKNAQLAEEMMVNKVVDYISIYNTLLNGADVITFTAGIGENAASFRTQVMEKLACLGVEIDAEANKTRGEIKEITTKNSKIKCFIVPTNEELMIARDTYNLAK